MKRLPVLSMTWVAALVVGGPAVVVRGAGTEVFRDDFGGAFSTANWSVAAWGTPHDRTQWGPTALVPVVSGGAATLKLNTYNADSPGVYLKGTEMVSKTQYALGTGMEFEARIRTDTTTPGIVTAFYLYGAHGAGSAYSDETDFEFLTKDNNPSPAAGDQVYLTNWNEWSSGSDSSDTTKHSYTHPTISGLDVTQYNTLMIRWLPDRTEWYINHALVRTTTEAVPNDPMNVIFNIWAPDSSWGSAYSAGLQPTANSAANVAHTMEIDYTAVRAIPANTWTRAGSGTWGAVGSWNTAAPSGVGVAVNFSNVPNAATTVTLEAARTVGSVTFDSANGYTLSGAGLTLDVASGAAGMTVNSGAHVIQSAVTLNDNTTVNVAAGASLALAGGVVGNVTLTKSTGTGALQLGVVRLAGLTVSSGRVQLATGTGTASKVNAVTAATGVLDLTDNALAIDYTGTSPAETIRTRLAQGRTAAGTWTNGSGILSSSAAGDGQKRTGIGYVEAKDLLGLSGTQTATWLGQTVDASTLLLQYTWYGDANLDGVVNADDFALIDRGFRKHLTGWANGDFDYDGNVTSADYLLIDRVFGQQSGTLSPAFLAGREGEFGAEYVAELMGSVPEPGLVALGFIPVFIRRGRNS